MGLFGTATVKSASAVANTSAGQELNLKQAHSSTSLTNPQSSDVFVKSALEQLINSKEGKKSVALKDACTKALGMMIDYESQSSLFF